MIRVIGETFLQLFVLSPLIFITLTDKKKEAFKLILLFAAFFMLNKVLLFLPLEYSQFKLIPGRWNWSGKLYALSGSLLFMKLYPGFSGADHFITLRQQPQFVKKGIICVLLVLLFVTALNFAFKSSSPFSRETIAFQLTMPGIDEEISFRGIMMGILMKASLKRIKTMPSAMLITSVLFGLVHSLFLNAEYEVSFSFFRFIQTSLYGLFWAWLTIRSGSIVLALISHNLSNTLLQLVRMW